jgi:hypothetical protein
MKTIYKYPLEVTDKVVITMPLGAEILCVQMQGITPCLWALVDYNTAKADITEERIIRIAGTGHGITEVIISYIGTVQLYKGNLIFHVFEVE